MDTAWTAIRTLTLQVAEAAPTTMVGLAQAAPRLEVRVRGGSLAGSPTSVTFAVWRGSGGLVEKLGTFTINLADIGTPLAPARFEYHASCMWVTVESFVAGSSPTVSATIEARPVFGS